MNEDDDNLLGIIHPISEGKDIKHVPEIKEPEMVTDEDHHEYAVLDWGSELKKPGVEKAFGDDPSKIDDETDPVLPEKVKEDIQK